jgi:RNA polymerase sigma-70 factor (ECF subfamily)
VAGDRKRFERVYVRRHDAVLRYCLRRSGREDALDATAETFSVAWRRRTNMPTGAELPWLYAVARRVLANQRRSARRRQAAVTRLRVIDATDTAADPEVQVVRDEDSRAVDAALTRLKPADQEVIRLAGWEELSREEIAVAMQCTPTAVTKRLNRALDRLARELGVAQRAGGRFFRRGEVAT